LRRAHGALGGEIERAPIARLTLLIATLFKT
jgi:hypothetical protein